MKHIQSWLAKNKLARNQKIKAYLTVKYYHSPNQKIPNKNTILKAYQRWNKKVNNYSTDQNPELKFYWENQIKSIIYDIKVYSKNKDTFDGAYLRSKLLYLAQDCCDKKHYDILAFFMKMKEFSYLDLCFNLSGIVYSSNCITDLHSYLNILQHIFHESCKNGNIKAIKLVIPKLMKFQHYNSIYKPEALEIAMQHNQKKAFDCIEKAKKYPTFKKNSVKYY